MKLFLYDDKHQQIISKLELGEVTSEQEELLNKIFDWFGNEGITNRYKNLILADNVTVTYEDDGFPNLAFE